MENKKKDKALRWPYGIALSFIGIIGLIYATIITSLEYPVENSDINMQNYHVYDKNVNEFIQKRIAFDKAFKLEYMSDPISTERAAVAFKLTDHAGNSINDAKVEAVLTRPNEHKYDITLKNPAVKDGIYTFDAVTLPKEGRWNIIAFFETSHYSRYMNLKVDTRDSNISEY